MKNIREPSKLEMQVLSVLWQRGPSTVREVLDAMPDGKTRAYTTILSVIQVMEKKGLLSHVAEGNAHVYKARVTRDKIAGPLLRNLVSQVFGGNAATALQHLLSGKTVEREELDEIKRLISEHEQKPEPRKKGKK
ncbi:MAG: BlaI/MecI/CopY family transcriptional regulator [Verrucomicrobia bacterium]|nr:BlaI/MecI/CopY family transcriptional regulator [Verrucomicrobiota bacterium]